MFKSNFIKKTLIFTSIIFVTLCFSACSNNDSSEEDSVTQTVTTSIPEENFESSEDDYSVTSHKKSTKVFDIEDGKTDPALIGKWMAENTPDIFYTFNENKTLIINISGSESTLLYYIKDSRIYMSTDENTFPSDKLYSVKKDVFVLGDPTNGETKFERVKTNKTE